MKPRQHPPLAGFYFARWRGFGDGWSVCCVVWFGVIVWRGKGWHAVRDVKMSVFEVFTASGYAVSWSPSFETRAEAEAWVARVGEGDGWDERVEVCYTGDGYEAYCDVCRSLAVLLPVGETAIFACEPCLSTM